MFPDRKRPYLCIEESNECVVYGHFNSSVGADEFMNKLAELIRVEVEK